MTVRLAEAGETKAMAALLTEAFAEDPVFRFMFPPGTSRRDARMRRMFAIEVGRSQRLGGAWISDDGAGAAVWYPPGHWEPSTAENLLQAPQWLAVFGRRIGLATKILTVLQEDHRRLGPHWYLYYMGVRAGQRSRGVGSSIMQPILDRCDTERTPAYLEATSPLNRALYLRHGFEPLDETTLPAGGPTMFPMWREPR